MAGKISTLILTVDLDCHLCHKKIQKALCKLQVSEHIQTIAYDEEKRTVTISGPFDPIKLKKKLFCKACKVIKEITIKEKDKNNKPESESAGRNKPVPVHFSFWPVGLVGPTMPVCCCRPCYVGYNDSCRCCSSGWVWAGPPPQPVDCKPVTYQFSCDCEEVSAPCTIM